MIRKLMTTALCLTALYGYGATPKLFEKLGGKNLAIIENAKYVTILSMIPEEARSRYQPLPEVHLDAEEIVRLKRNLLDDHNYDFERQKNCNFNPEISFKFQDENDQILHVFVSPSCNQLLFGTGSKTVMLNYDPAQQRLEHFLQQLIVETRMKNQPKRDRA